MDIEFTIKEISSKWKKKENAMIVELDDEKLLELEMKDI